MYSRKNTEQKNTDEENSVIIALKSFFEAVAYLNKDQISAIAKKPESIGLSSTGVSAIILNDSQKTDTHDDLENSIIKTLLAMEKCDRDFVEDHYNEKDKEFGNTPLHWCALLGFHEVAEFLIEEAWQESTSLNKMGLTYTQLAALSGQNRCVTERLFRIPRLSEVSINGNKIKFCLNELSIAVITGNSQLVKDILDTLAKKYVNINNISNEVKGIGNLLHLYVYGALYAKKLNNKFDDGYKILELLMGLMGPMSHSYHTNLTSGNSCPENLDPLSLATKHGLTEIVSELINAPKLDGNDIANYITNAITVAKKHGQKEIESLLTAYLHKPSSTDESKNTSQSLAPTAPRLATQSRASLFNSSQSSESKAGSNIKSIIETWLNKLASDLTKKESPYKDIIKEATSGKESEDSYLSLAQYSVAGNPSRSPFPLPDSLSVSDIIATIPEEGLEVTINQRDSELDGFRLKLLKREYCKPVVDMNSNSGMALAFNVFFLPLSLAGDKVQGFEVVLKSPIPKNSCRIC